MQSKTSLKRLWFTMSLVFFSIMVFSSSVEVFAQTAVKTILFTRSQMLQKWMNQQSQNILPSEQEDKGLPIRLKIPSIKVNATIESVGLTAQDAVGVPKVPMNSAWFNLGPRPGESGNAVITGHIGRWKSGSGSVFDNLHKLQKDDRLFIENETGAITSFVVRESRKYDANEDTAEIFHSDDGKAHLILITCDGIWNKVSQSYPKRLVIFTDKE